MCNSPVMLPSNRQTSDILTEHTVGKSLQILFYTMSPRKISQKVDTLVLIHGNVFPWQPTPMGNKASFY